MRNQLAAALAIMLALCPIVAAAQADLPAEEAAKSPPSVHKTDPDAGMERNQKKVDGKLSGNEPKVDVPLHEQPEPIPLNAPLPTEVPTNSFGSYAAAMTRLPTTTTVKSITDESSSSRNDSTESGTASKDLVELFVFQGAAHFPWLGFSRVGEPVPRDMLTIYEGMTISASANGNYEIRYQVEAPLAEITLRMQVHFVTCLGQTGTITLAPAHIHPQAEEDHNILSQSFEICHRGNSPALKQAFCSLVESAQTLTPPQFHRTGTTRFGAIPAK